MSLSAADVAEIMRLVEQSQFDELTLEMDGVKLTLRRGAAVASGGAGAASVGGGGVAPGSAASPSSTSSAAQKNSSATPSSAGVASAALASISPGGGADTAATRDARKSESAPKPLEPGVVEVPSPLLGTFYRAPKPGAAPFVEVGAKVEEDTVVAIVEVMKLMNTVRAGVRGTVTEVLASDGALVEYEQPLFRVRKAG